jgi:hypothetical protein
MFTDAARELDNPRAAAQQLAATFTHGVLGRVVTLMVLEGRAWDPGPENLWMHVPRAAETPGPPADGPRVSHAGSIPVNTKACNQSSR